ncbi:MAG: MFS transporter [Acidobacteria bacterium]|nr:MFS transporter [Acidobacteriota bacterium]
MRHVSLDSARRPQAAWYREVTATQWKAFAGAYMGWVLDGFDFTIITFLLVDIRQSFTVDAALAGLLGTITLIFRVAGGIGAGTAADRWGRKGPLMFSILWYSLFSFLGGFSSSYRMLFAIRALFGIGMGGVWAAGMPLTLEHWPAHLRGTASGMMQSGYSMGFLLSSLVFQFVYPVVGAGTDMGWRVMLWIGILPAFLVFFIMRGVKESPVWLERQRHLQATNQKDSLSLPRLFKRDLIGTTLHTSILMAAFLFMYAAVHGGAEHRRHHRRARVRPIVGGVAGPARRRHDRDRGRHPLAAALCVHAERGADDRRRAGDGVFRRRQFRCRARLPDGTIPDDRARRRRRLRVPRRCRPRLLDAVHRRDDAGPRLRAVDGDGGLHRRFRRAGDRDAMARPGNARHSLPRRALMLGTGAVGAWGWGSFL